MKSKKTKEFEGALKKNFSRLVQAGIPTNKINTEDFCYFLDHSYFIGEFNDPNDFSGEDFEITEQTNEDLFFLHEFILEHFEYSFQEIEWEIERRLYQKIRYSNRVTDDERIVYFTILKRKMNREMEYTVRILEDDDLFGQDINDVVEEIETMFIIHALDGSSTLKEVEFLLQDHPRKNKIKSAYLSLIKKRRKVFDPYFDRLIWAL